MILICKSLMIGDIEHLFMYLLAICMSSVEKNVYSGLLLIFKIGLFLFLILSYMSSLYILDISPLSDILFVNIFSHSVGCLFILLMISFPVQNILSLISSHLFIFVFFPLPRETYPKKYCHNLGQRTYCLCYLLISLIYM